MNGANARGLQANLALSWILAYLTLMTRFFDIADHDRLPWRFTALNRSVLARL
jgi:hypothetical protein